MGTIALMDCRRQGEQGIGTCMWKKWKMGMSEEKLVPIAVILYNYSLIN